MPFFDCEHRQILSLEVVLLKAGQYARSQCQVQQRPGDTWPTAYVYIYNKDVIGKKLIDGGDYVSYRKGAIPSVSVLP